MSISRRKFVAGAAASVVAAAVGAGDSPALPQRRLSNGAASAEARALYRFLWDIWGKKTLTGQQESIWIRGPDHEMDYIKRVSGKLPAIRGLDYLNPRDNPNVNRRIVQWSRKGGIASVCWHWGNPLNGPGYESSKMDFDVAAALSPNTAEHRAMMRDMAMIADLLSELRDAGVPVLWRPFHEFTGDWFWWGKPGPELFKRLWITQYDYFTNERKLNNLIWVLGYTKDPSAAYFPGLEYVDIVGADDYVDDHGPLQDMFARTQAATGNALPIALHENGPIPDPHQVTAMQANWLWFLTWTGEWITEAKWNTSDQVKAFYNSDRYLTLDELPDLRRYGL